MAAEKFWELFGKKSGAWREEGYSLRVRCRSGARERQAPE